VEPEGLGTGALALVAFMDEHSVGLIPGATCTWHLVSMEEFRRAWSGIVILPRRTQQDWRHSRRMAAFAAALLAIILLWSAQRSAQYKEHVPCC
jgi:hypothetical protein